MTQIAAFHLSIAKGVDGVFIEVANLAHYE